MGSLRVPTREFKFRERGMQVRQMTHTPKGRLQTACLILLLSGGAALGGCSSPAEPEGQVQPTLFVENPLCDAAGCRPVHIRAFVWTFTVPQSPFGGKAVAVVDGPSLCIVFPPKWELVVTHWDKTGTRVVGKDTLTWTPDDPLFITALERTDGFNLLGATETFSPADAIGWRLRFTNTPSSSGTPFTAQLTTDARCEPSQ